MVSKPCAKCGKIIPYGKSLCPSCQQIADRKREERLAVKRQQWKQTANHNYNMKRNKDEQRFYSSKQWKILSAGYMQQQMWKCERCGQLATEVHHIQPIQTAEGWARRFDATNLRALCLRCHNEEHNRFGGQKHQG